jgi:hypothetical protein
MIRLLQWLFIGHVHKWKIIREGAVDIYAEQVGKGKPITAHKYIQQCEGCGKLRNFNTQEGYTS